MSTPDPDRLEALFWDIADLPGDERRHALEDVCDGDEDLRRELSGLIEAYQEATSDSGDVGRDLPGTDWLQHRLSRIYHRGTYAQPPEPILTGRTFAHFRVTERIGRGGMGVVYLGEDLNLGRPVALKFLPPHLSADVTAKKRFVHEAKAASSLNHRNICTIHEIGETEDGQLFIAMAYYEGQTLRERLDRGDPPTAEEAIDIAAQIVDGLARAHRQGIVHRDIKPGNIMLGEDGDVVILDFGLAKLSGATQLTTTGHTIGTAAYMSPEQVRGEKVGEATDVWSLGVLLYEMLAGERPFGGEYIEALIYAVLNEDPPPLTDVTGVSDDVGRIVERCLQKDAIDRFPSAAELREEIRSIRPDTRMESGIPVLLDLVVSRMRRMGRRHRISWIAAAVSVLTAALVLTWTQVVKPVGHMELLAVLPFDVIGNAYDAESYAAGLQESLSSKLSQLAVPEVTVGVVPASEIPAQLTVGRARSVLGATLAIEGSIQFEDGRIRLALNLINTGSLYQIDSRLMTDDATSSLAIQDRAVMLVAEMLEMELDPDARSGVTRSSSKSRHANDFYLRATGRLHDAQSLDDIDSAISLFDLAVREDSEFSVALAGLGQAYWEKYRRTRDVQWAERAIEYSEQALSLDDKSEPVYLTLGKIYAGRGMYDEALRALDRAAEIDPFDPEIYLQSGTVWRNRDRYDLASDDYNRAIAIDAGYWRGHLFLGSLLYRAGEYQRAVVAWQRGLDHAPGNADLLANLGAAQWALERLEPALHSFEKALDSDPEHPRAKSNLGTAYFYMGRFDDAAHFFDEKLSIAPSDRLAAAYLADTYCWIPQERQRAPDLYRRALGLALKQLEIQPSDPEVLADAAYFYAALQRPDSAGIYLSMAVDRLSPDSSDVALVFAVGEVYERMNRRDEAVGWIAAALERGVNRIRLRHSPFLADIRRDERVAAYLGETSL